VVFGRVERDWRDCVVVRVFAVVEFVGRVKSCLEWLVASNI